jgi:CHAT domain-containing protein
MRVLKNIVLFSLLLFSQLLFGQTNCADPQKDSLTFRKLYKELDEASTSKQHQRVNELYEQMKHKLCTAQDTFSFGEATFLHLNSFIMQEKFEEANKLYEEEVKTNFLKQTFQHTPLFYSLILQRFCILFSTEKYRNTKGDKRNLWYNEIDEIWEKIVKHTPTQEYINYYAVGVAARADFHRRTQKYQAAKEGYKEASAVLLGTLQNNTSLIQQTNANVVIDFNELLLEQYEYGEVEKNLLILKNILKQKNFAKQYVDCLDLLGKLYLLTNQADKAEKFVREALSHTNNTKQEPILNNLLAKVYMAKGNCLGAMVAYEVADLGFYEVKTIDMLYNRIDWAESIITCSENYEDAREKLEMPFSKEFASNFDSLSLYYIKGIQLLGDIARMENKLQEAEKYYDKAQRLYAKSEINPLHQNLISLAISRGVIKLHNKDFLQALDFIGEANDKITSTIKNNFSYMTEKERLVLLNNPDYENSKQLEAQFINKISDFPKQTVYQSFLQKAFNRKIALRGLLLNENIKLRKIMTNNPDSSLQHKYLQWREYKNFVARAIISQPTLKLLHTQKELNLPVNYQDSLANILEKELNEQVGKTKHLVSNVDYLAMSKKLNAAEAVVIITRGDFLFENDSTITYSALLMDKNGIINVCKLVKLSNATEEINYLQDYHKNLGDKHKSTQIYKIFWQTLAKKLAALNISKIYLCPDGIYHKLNLSTLYNPATKKYVEQEVAITLVTNPKDILEWDTPKLTAKTAVLMGNPTYKIAANEYEQWKAMAKPNNNPTEENERGGIPQNYEFAALPNTAQEVQIIGKELETNKIEVKYYTQKSATKTQIQQLKSPTILHLATHGYWETSSTLDPMLRSALVLAGVTNYYHQPETERNPDKDNGLLTAQEVAVLNLENTQLVVLSACETGLGTVENGEGVYGLQRAFKVAGAKTLLMSLWKIDDKVATDFMTYFYHAMLEGKTKHEAFKATKKLFIDNGYSPRDWGSFVLVGE